MKYIASCFSLTLMLSLFLGQSCTNQAPSDDSLKSVYPKLKESEESLKKKDSFIAETKARLAADSSNLDNWIWYGRRLAYTQEYEKSVDIFTEALDRFPNSAELYRHRGHRFISLREFDKAIADLEKARAIAKDMPVTEEKDGIPNRLNIPLSNLQFNIWYHLGLAYFFKADFRKSREVLQECIRYSINPDLIVATTDWLYMANRRLNDTLTANRVLTLVRDEFEVIENEGYYNLVKMYKGELSPEELLILDAVEEDNILQAITQGYGVGHWYLVEGDTMKATRVFEEVIELGYWPAFAYIAAELEIERLPPGSEEEK